MKENQIKVLLVRARPNGINREDQFVEDGVVSVGWPDAPSFEGKSRTEIEEILKQSGHDVTNLVITQLFNFSHHPAGSIILTPSIRKTQDIHIFKTVSAYEYDPERIKDGNPHIIRCELIRTMSKTDFCEQVQRSIKAARRTVTNFTKYISEILDVIGREHFQDELVETGETKVAVDAPLETEISVSVGKDAKESARKALEGLLQSENEEIRLKAALALMEDK